MADSPGVMPNPNIRIDPYLAANFSELAAEIVILALVSAADQFKPEPSSDLCAFGNVRRRYRLKTVNHRRADCQKSSCNCIHLPQAPDFGSLAGDLALGEFGDGGGLLVPAVM